MSLAVQRRICVNFTSPKDVRREIGKSLAIEPSFLENILTRFLHWALFQTAGNKQLKYQNCCIFFSNCSLINYAMLSNEAYSTHQDFAVRDGTREACAVVDIGLRVKKRISKRCYWRQKIVPFNRGATQDHTLRNDIVSSSTNETTTRSQLWYEKDYFNNARHELFAKLFSCFCIIARSKKHHSHLR